MTAATARGEPGANARPAAELVADFLEPGALAAEHERLMRGQRRPFDWARSTAGSLPADLRGRLADMWRGRMIAEHRSAGIFAQHAVSLLSVGAPAEVVSVACRAALDEVRHAELFSRVATLYSGRDESPPPGVSPMPDDTTVPLSHQVARESLFLSIVSETYSAVLLDEGRARATDPVVRDALGIVLADEVFHARLGWSYIATLLGAGTDAARRLRAWLGEEMPRAFDAFVSELFGDPSALPPPSLVGEERALGEAHGYMARRDEYALFLSTIESVWVPGLSALGLDASRLAGRFARVARS